MPEKCPKWCFFPYSGDKKCKKWRISAGLRAKIPRWGGKNAPFCDGAGDYSYKQVDILARCVNVSNIVKQRGICMFSQDYKLTETLNKLRVYIAKNCDNAKSR